VIFGGLFKRKSADGDAVDVDAVVREHGPAVWRLLKRVFGQHADIEDTFQQVMLELVRALPGFEGKSELTTWIHRIALNVAYQRMRRGYRGVEVDLDEAGAPAADVDVEREVQDQQAARELYEALEALPPKKRIAVVLHDVEGLTLKEISERLGIPLQTVASQLHTGRAQLAEELHARGLDDGRTATRTGSSSSSSPSSSSSRRRS
jgi:RNA polymerase sigma-70 factor (ECF subfamily)